MMIGWFVAIGACGVNGIVDHPQILAAQGAFSLASRPVQLGYLPRLRVVHTSASTYGQVYMRWINGMLMVAILTWCSRSAARRHWLTPTGWR